MSKTTSSRANALKIRTKHARTPTGTRRRQRTKKNVNLSDKHAQINAADRVDRAALGLAQVPVDIYQTTSDGEITTRCGVTYKYFEDIISDKPILKLYMRRARAVLDEFMFDFEALSYMENYGILFEHINQFLASRDKIATAHIEGNWLVVSK